ncbi:MAG: HIT domain-containing protein [Propionibacteriaceae bacterium]|jgi:histidine triad (HIT) family protein|nr:HIT domain-containing protein [Propionibacteriaceae bacterium]
MSKASDCLFCRIVAGEVPSRQVYADDTCVGFLDLMPLHRGHTLVVPRRHVDDGVTEAAAWAEVAPGIVAVSDLLKQRLDAVGFNILANAGEIAGQTMFHFHVHIIPRYAHHAGMGKMMSRDPKAADDLDGLLAELVG